jgi:C-terminal processing protease CtpA/Prc
VIQLKRRIFAVVLALGLLLTSAGALTVDQARELLSTYYIDEIPDEVLAQPTIEDILNALGDPYTDYYTAQEYAAFLSGMEDTQLVGIGIQAYYLEEGVLLDLVAPDSPASDGGLRPGDYIIAVDGHDTRGAARDDVDSWIRGDEGTSVALTVLRGEETFSVTLTRRVVVFPTVTLDKVENGVGWITCTAFGPTTFAYFYDIITAYDDQVQGWVVDLRGNGGGDLLAATFSAGCFAGSAGGAYLRDRTGTYYGYFSDPSQIAALGYYDGELSGFSSDGYLTEHPVYVLTDAGTASASEFFCAAIRDSGAGLIIGSRTYGKGVAQSLLSGDVAGLAEYFPDGDALKVTTQRGYATRGATYDKVGILPHFLVDGDQAGQVAALLAAPVSQEEDALILTGVSSASLLINNVTLSLSQLRDPTNAQATEQLFSALPAAVSCSLRVDGTVTSVTREQAAQTCGVELEEIFSDLADCTESEAVETLGIYGIVNGVGDGSFRPQTDLDRASLCALLVKALRFSAVDSQTPFADVNADAWYAPYVSAMYDMGLIEGEDDGLFHPDDPLTHEQFLTILGRTAQWLSMDCYEMSRRDGIYNQLPDQETLAQTYPSYAAWARELIWLCDDVGIWDDLNQVDATEATTREQAADALYTLLRETGSLPA